MGRIFAEEIAEFENVNLEYMIGVHLQHNHYPPVSLDFVPTCIEAMELASSGDGECIIAMPNGKYISAYNIIEGLHLESFVRDGDVY